MTPLVTYPIKFPTERIHVTERASFRSCRRYWYFNNVMGLYSTSGSNKALSLGTAAHTVLANYYVHKWNLEKGLYQSFTWTQALDRHILLFRSKLEEDQATLLEGILRGYFDWAEDQDQDYEVVTIDGSPAVEMSFEWFAPGTDRPLVGTIDLLLLHKPTSKYWIVDHKTCSQFWSDSDLETSDQMSAYKFLVENKLQVPVAGVLLNQLLKVYPREPPTVYNGTRLSTAKNLETNYDLYISAIRRHGFDPDDYEDILDRLKYKEFFKRSKITRNKAQVQRFKEDTTQELQDMCDPYIKIYPNFESHCERCSMNAICETYQSGGDWQSLIGTAYKQQDLRP